VILWGSFAVLAALLALQPFRISVRYGTRAAVVLVTGWLGFWAGSGPYYALLVPDFGILGGSRTRTAVQWLTELPSHMMALVHGARTGFLSSGGGTNIVVPLRDDPAVVEQYKRELDRRATQSTVYRARARGLEGNIEGDSTAVTTPASSPQPAAVEAGGAERAAPVSAAREASIPNDPRLAVPVTMADRIRTTLIGLAVVFVPINLVKLIVGFDFAGGRGLLSVSDLDTIVMDCGLVLAVLFLWRRRAAIGERVPVVVFSSVFSITTAVLLGYVVTNFGTLWRMRPMVAVPILLAAVALGGPRPAGAAAQPIP
jgi:hypothetical protein